MSISDFRNLNYSSACMDTGITYKATQLDGTSSIPSFMEFNAFTKTFDIYTDRKFDAGQYITKITATLGDYYAKNENTFLWTLVVVK